MSSADLVQTNGFGLRCGLRADSLRRTYSLDSGTRSSHVGPRSRCGLEAMLASGRGRARHRLERCRWRFPPDRPPVTMSRSSVPACCALVRAATAAVLADRRVRAPTLARRLAGVALLLVAGACADAPTAAELSPTAPAGLSQTPAISTVLPAKAAALITLGADLVDATDMFLVAIDDAPARTELRVVIATLADRLSAGNATAATNILATARKRLSGLQGKAALPELAPLDLALDRVEQVLQGL